MKNPFKKARKTEPETSHLDVELDIAIRQKFRADERFEQTNKVVERFVLQVKGAPKNA